MPMLKNRASAPELAHPQYHSEDITFIEHAISERFPGYSSADEVSLAAFHLDTSMWQTTGSFFEFAYALQGTCECNTGSQAIYMLEDSLTIIAPSTTYKLRALEPGSIFVLLAVRTSLFTTDLFAEFLLQGGILARFLAGAGDEECLQLFDARGDLLRRSMVALVKEYVHAGSAPSVAVRARTLLFLAELSEREGYSKLGIDKETLRMLNYIDDHAADVSVAELARHFGYNTTYFSQYVRSHTGEKPSRLITEARLRRAIELLETTRRSVEDIAATVGYRSYSHFHRIFVAEYHVTPARYRRFVQEKQSRGTTVTVTSIAR